MQAGSSSYDTVSTRSRWSAGLTPFRLSFQLGIDVDGLFLMGASERDARSREGTPGTPKVGSNPAASTNLP